METTEKQTNIRPGARVTVVMGTRPEAIRLCPLIRELRNRGEARVRVLSTGQHRQTLDGAMETFGVRPDFDLDVMRTGQSFSQVAARILRGTDEIYSEEKPELVVVQGDSVTAFAASLAAFYRNIPVAHIEAGLRSHHVRSPFPEELHRTVAAKLAEYHFVPTVSAKRGLIRDGIDERRVYISGNPVVDALRFTLTEGKPAAEWDFPADSRVLLFTAHRRESLGAPIEGVFRALRRVVEETPDLIAVCPLHHNPEVRKVAELLSGVPRIRVVDPPEIVSFHRLLARTDLILTDSAGIREEAEALGIPTVVTRYSAEQQESIRAGVLRLAGSGEAGICEVVKRLLAKDSEEYRSMKKPSAVAGGVSAVSRIADVITQILR